MNRFLAIIDATSKEQLGLLTIHRMPGALPFAGKYRLIDFALSNIKHANIKNVAVFPYGNYRSLQDHVGSGKRWDLDRRHDGLFILPPKNMAVTSEDMISFQRMHEHIEHFRRSTQDHVLITQANIVWSIDFNSVLDNHIASKADITEIICEKKRLKTFIISKSKLLNYVNHYDAIPYNTLNDVVRFAPSIQINTYVHQGYVRYIKDTFNYLKGNLDMLRFDRGTQIFLPERPIISKEKTAPPARYETHAQVTNSMIASGSIIDGIIKHSIIGRDVTIKRGAVVENSIIMSNSVVEANASIHYGILDKSTVIKEDTVIEGTLFDPYVTQKYQVVTNQSHINVLHVASEANPFVKTGGLADVVQGLSEHLAKRGTTVKVIIPLYKQVKARFEEALKLVETRVIHYGDEPCKINIYQMNYHQVDFYFLENFRYFERDEIYGYDDDCDRFALFNHAIVEMIDLFGELDLIHLHDWHTGLIPLILKQRHKNPPKTLLTLHNIDYQGECKLDILDKLGIDYQSDFEQTLNFLKTGITHATKLSTVSPTYRDELRYEYYGKKLTPVLLKRERDFYGILNGISTQLKPEHDTAIAKQYSEKTLADKLENKRYLQRNMDLIENDKAFVIGCVSRLAEQKGFDIMLPALEQFLHKHEDVQFVLLGQGNQHYIDRLEELKAHYPKRIALNIGYDATLPNYIYAGADLFLMPSRVEPCGLSQMIAMHYGTVPLVRQTGGLADTVEAYDSVTKQGKGFMFFNYDTPSLLQALQDAYTLYSKDQTTWKKMMIRGMQSDFSLIRQATKMLELYRLII